MSFGGLINSHAMSSGAIAQFPFSLSLKNKMEGHDDMGLLGDNDFDPSNLLGRNREDGYESRSGSDNVEGASVDDQEANQDGPPRKKYHRHTPQQIQELESFFKECPHPDDKQRNELSRRLGLESRQIKFWFQNRRTQMKTQMERHENVILRQEHDKLRAENNMLKEAMRNPICSNCGGLAVPGNNNAANYEVQQLRIDNARLKDELNRICMLANKFLGRPLASSGSPVDSQSLNSGLELAVGRNEFGGVTLPDSTMPVGLELGEGPAMSLMKQPMAGAMGNEISYDKNMFVDLALAAMAELMKMAELDSPLWVSSLDGGKDVLDQDEYVRTFPPLIGMKPPGFVTEATRETGVVIINSLALVETLMNVNRWAEMFPCMVGGAATIDMIASGAAGSKDGAMQMMFAEFQMLSPLVPLRQMRFLRYCKQHAEGLWAVVDVSIDINREGPNGDTFVACRRLPSGCVVQDLPNNYSKVTWIEHSEYNENVVHNLCRPLISSGLGFGAQRWVAALQRQCECLAVIMSSVITDDGPRGMTAEGKKSLLKLAQRMTLNFCSGICASSARKWDKLRVGNVSEDVRVLTRKNLNDPGEPAGIVLCAATSVWMPVTRQRLFDLLRDERMRINWDILSNGGHMQGVIHLPKGQNTPGNCVSLLRASVVSATENAMLIVQETWNDASGSIVVYAPVDLPSVNMIVNGGDPACVALLPSGFAILPDGQTGHGTVNNSEANSGPTGGSILTVGFQILVNSLPTAKLTVESVETVNNLISCTIQKIKAAVQEN